jgi:hypothetical protein
MKPLIFLTSIAAAEAALPLKNFPGNKRGLVAFTPPATASTTLGDCSFSTLGDLLPDDTVEYDVFGDDIAAGYIGGIATRIQLSNKDGYKYYMRGSDADLFSEFAKNFAYVQCAEIEDGELTPTERTKTTTTINDRAHCGFGDVGIRKLGNVDSVIYGGSDTTGTNMALDSDPGLFNTYYVSGGLCKATDMKNGAGTTHQIIATSSCTDVGKYAIADATYANGISKVTKSCETTAGTTDPSVSTFGDGCTVTIGSETIDVAIASKCGNDGGRDEYSRTIGSVEEAFVWYRSTRPQVVYTIKPDPTDKDLKIVTFDAPGEQVNNWIGDILFTRPPKTKTNTISPNPVLATPSYVSAASSSVTFSSNTAGPSGSSIAKANRCSIADSAAYNGINSHFGTNENIDPGHWKCQAKLDASVTLVNKVVGGCTPGAFLKSSLVQFARIHKTHIEVGTNATKFANDSTLLHTTLGYHNRFNGAAQKYAEIAMGPGNIANQASMLTWQCETNDECKTGNPFVLLQYNEKAGIWDPTLAANNGTFTVFTASGYQDLKDPGTVYAATPSDTDTVAAIAYTYVIGYVDFGYGCFKATISKSELNDETKFTRRLAAEPEEWEVHSQITFAGGHHIDLN